MKPRASKFREIDAAASRAAHRKAEIFLTPYREYRASVTFATGLESGQPFAIARCGCIATAP